MRMRLLLASAACAALAAAGNAMAATTTMRVTPSSMNGWSFFTEGSGPTAGTLVAGPPGAPIGIGSARLPVSALTQGQSLGTGAYAGTRLADITALGYSSYQAGPTLAIALQFDVDYNDPALPSPHPYQGRLVFEPRQNGTVVVGSGWRQWSPLSGRWWASRTGSPGTNGRCGIASPCTWAQILGFWPNAKISAALLFKAGSGWASFDGNVDAFTIGIGGSDTTWNFDTDETAPTVTVIVTSTNPGEATGPGGAPMTYSTAVSDADPNVSAATCGPLASGATFPLETMTVTCSATDTSGNTGYGSATVTVQDTTPPVLSLPADITVPQTIPAGAPVSYTATANDTVDGVLPATCTPPPGSTFPVGTTTVICTAKDGQANTGTDSFTITVVSAGDQLDALIADVQSAELEKRLEKKLAKTLEEAKGELASSRGKHPTKPECKKLEEFVKDVQREASKGRLGGPTAGNWITRAENIRNALGCASS